MSLAADLAREETLADALRAVNDAIGEEPPDDQAFRIIAAIKALFPVTSARVAKLAPVDYFTTLQARARAAWKSEYEGNSIGPECDAVAGIETPLGRLKMVTWRRVWRNGRIAWASEYDLNGQPISIAEIRAVGLAQRPTTRKTRKRKKKGTR
jgi:hypothetical protein